MSVSDTGSGSPQTVALSGTGASTSGGSVTASPTSLSFPSTTVGSTSVAQTATLKNGTSSSITISSVALGGTNPGDFVISSKTCGTSLAASASCTASVEFKPTATGTRAATLSFADSGSGSPQVVTVSGGSTSAGAFEIEPTNPTVVVNNTLQFSATVDVTWSASCGSISSTSGIFSAPSTTGTCTVTATEIGGSHPTVSTSVKVTSSPSSGTLQIYPTSAAVYAGTQQIYQAQLSQVPDGHSLTYSVDGVVGGNSTVGTITNEGVYTAPSVAAKHTITVKDNSLGTSVSGSATVYTNVTVDFGSLSKTQHPIPAHIFGAERMDSLRNTADLDLVKGGGISYARFYALIPATFATTTPNWNSIDAAVQRISAGGVKIMLQMYQTPPWLQPSPNPCGSGDPNVPPTDNTKWGQMAAQYIQHMDSKFPGVVTDYEIWNEPNTTALCTSAANRESVYLALYKTAVPIMRAQAAADGKGARVGGPATAGVPSAWVNAMLSDSVISQNIDFLSYHIYPFSNVQLGAQWDTYNGVISVLQSTQNSGLGPLDYYLNAAKLVAAGKQPQGKNLPIYNSEYNIDWAFAKSCCQNDPTYAPVWNGLFIAGGLNSVYYGASNVMQHMVYFAATAHPYFCLIGEINANMDCTYPTNPVPYPQYFLYQMFGSPSYLGLQNGGYMAQSIAPGYLGNGLVTTAFYTSSLDAVVLINPSGTTLNNVPINISNTGISSASATLYQIENGQTIDSSSLSLKSTNGTSYSTSVTMQPYSVQAISIHH
ncbi:MAG TPA: choice-of-anchor D domain-containing protein [Terracidiphilus sp.]